MPNYTLNKLTVFGDYETLTAFKNRLKSKTCDEALDNENVIPCNGNSLSPEFMRFLVQMKMNRLSCRVEGNYIVYFYDDEEALAKMEWPKTHPTDWQIDRYGTRLGIYDSWLVKESNNCLHLWVQ